MKAISKLEGIIFFACALHWVWGCSLLFSTEPSRIAAWGAYSYLPNQILGLLFMFTATLAYIGTYKWKSTWCLVPQQLILTGIAYSQITLILAGHYADWVFRPPFFIFRDQLWGILLAIMHLGAMFLLFLSNCKQTMKHKLTLQNLTTYSFETGVAVYTLINALLTFNPNSAVLVNLWQMIGGYSLIAVCYQIFAAGSVLYGMASKRFNVEIMGLILLCSTFAIRATVLLTDNDITLSDINSTCLAITLIGASLVRAIRLVKTHTSPCSQT